MSKRLLAPLSIVVAFIVGVGSRLPLHTQVKDPLVGGTWERYSIKDAQGTEIGQGPGWFFLVFTEDGRFFITGVPKGREKLAKPAKDMTKDELLKHLYGMELRIDVDGMNVRRGTYTLTGNGSPYTLRLKEEVNAFSPTLNEPTLQVWMENGEAHIRRPGSENVVVAWRRAG